MKKISWDESFSVHVAELDLQHQKLFDLINQLYVTWGKSKNVATQLSMMDEMSMQYNAIEELAEYAVYHFTTEEEYMEKSQHSGLDYHKKEHDEFVSKINVIKEGFRSGKEVKTSDIIRFLVEWLKGHILGTDKLYDPTS